MNPSQLARMSRIVELEMQSPGSGAADFGILSGTQEADSRTIIPAQPPVMAPVPINGQQGPPRRRGRPPLIDHDKREKILQMLENGFSQPICAAHVGISLRTLRREMVRNPEFRERAERAETLFEEWPLMTILRAARKNWRAASWLMTHMPHVSVRRRKRMEELEESQQLAAPQPVAAPPRPCAGSGSEGKYPPTPRAA